MNLKKITIITLVLLLFFFEVQTNNASAQTSSQYQLYRLSDDASNDRRPKLAINDQGIVWIAWESNRDGDFDVYGRRFENGTWTGLIEITLDTVNIFLNDMLYDHEGKLVVFETRTDSMYGIVKIIGSTFLTSILNDSIGEKKFLCKSHFFYPYYGTYEFYICDPKVISFQKDVFICYHRSKEIDVNNYPWQDSLFTMHVTGNEYSPEECDTVFHCWRASPYGNFYRIPKQQISFLTKGLFLIYNYNDYGGAIKYWHHRDLGFIIDNNLYRKYILLSYNTGYYGHGEKGIVSHCYGSSKNSLFVAGHYVRSNRNVVRELDLEVDSAAVIIHEWPLEHNENITISQNSDLIAFSWIENSSLFVKTYRDSIWYETLEIPLDNLKNIGLSFHCSVFNNQLIWITFDAISNDNKDVYALSVPACFVIDTVLTSVKRIIQNNTFPNDFALFQNYPNPFNSSTKIKYSLPQDESSYHVTLKIYDIRGRLVNTLVDQNQAAGTYLVSWDGKDINENDVSSEIYFYTLQADKFKTTNKMLLIY